MTKSNTPKTSFQLLQNKVGPIFWNVWCSRNIVEIFPNISNTLEFYFGYRGLWLQMGCFLTITAFWYFTLFFNSIVTGLVAVLKQGPALIGVFGILSIHQNYFSQLHSPSLLLVLVYEYKNHTIQFSLWSRGEGGTPSMLIIADRPPILLAAFSSTAWRLIMLFIFSFAGQRAAQARAVNTPKVCSKAILLPYRRSPKELCVFCEGY